MSAFAARPAPGRVRQSIARLARHRFARFLVVGVINTIFGYGVFFILLRMGLAPTAALAVSTSLGVLFNFLTTGRIVFANSDATRLWRFVAVYGLVFIFNAACLEGALAIGAGAALAQALLLAPCVALSYFLNRTLVFNIGQKARNP
ncbi:GtrA family protein [Methylocystis sp. WRRC1]|uniref:GtrA family protein n=1 Tax=Methylocystis sp. WRRC1 TaxID=1732014 RepID=UPI001D14589E|nr:GtrA family protein [Methylocystis sp. WRRC1]MCC3245814.1 GtrA family protein [Methylocystis sp. WRRC1]